MIYKQLSVFFCISGFLFFSVTSEGNQTQSVLSNTEPISVSKPADKVNSSTPSVLRSKNNNLARKNESVENETRFNTKQKQANIQSNQAASPLNSSTSSNQSTRLQNGKQKSTIQLHENKNVTLSQNLTENHAENNQKKQRNNIKGPEHNLNTTYSLPDTKTKSNSEKDINYQKLTSKPVDLERNLNKNKTNILNVGISSSNKATNKESQVTHITSTTSITKVLDGTKTKSPKETQSNVQINSNQNIESGSQQTIESQQSNNRNLGKTSGNYKTTPRLHINGQDNTLDKQETPNEKIDYKVKGDGSGGKVNEAPDQFIGKIENESGSKSYFFVYAVVGLFTALILYILFQKKHKIIGLIVEGYRPRSSGTRSRSRSSSGSRSGQIAYKPLPTEEKPESVHKFIY